MKYSEPIHIRTFKPERAGRFASFEDFAMLLLPIAETLSTSLGDMPFFDGLKSALFAMLFGASALSARVPTTWRRGPLRIWLVLLLSYTLFSRLIYLGSIDAGPVVLIGSLMAIPSLLWLLNNTVSADRFRSLMTSLVVGAVIGGLISSAFSIQILLGTGARGWAQVSMEVSANRNTLAPIYAVALSAIIFLEINIARRMKAACAVIIVIALLLLFSRSGYIALSLLALVASFANPKARRMVFPLIIVVGILLSVPDNPFLDRIDYTFQGRGGSGFDDSTSARLDIWSAAWAEFQEHPIVGGGSGKSPLPFYDLRHDEIIYAHNYFLTQLSQLGIIGFLITVGTFLSFFVQSIKQSGDVRAFALSFLLIIMATSISGEPLYSLTAYLFYAVAAYISRSVARPMNARNY